jgi:hypothetical protein
LSSIESFVHELASRIATTLEIGQEAVDAMRKYPGTPPLKLNKFFRDRLLPGVSGALVFAIDHGDRLLGAPWCDNFFSLLRAWSDCADDEPWSRLRIVVGMSSAPALATTDIHQSPFANVASQIRIVDLDAGRVARLAALHGLSWTDEEVFALMALVGGHPFLVRVAMYHAARSSTPVATLLRDKHPIFDPFLDRIRWDLSKSPELLDACRKLSVDVPHRAHSEALIRLRHAGVARFASGGYTLRYRLYERLLNAPER